MDPDSPGSSDSESDILLGLLESLDSEILLGFQGELSWNQQQEVSDEADSIPTAPSSPVGTTPIKLETINELIRFDHVYTKPLCSEQDAELEIESSVVIKTEEAAFNTSCVSPISVKEESQEEEPTPVLGLLSGSENNMEKPGNLLDGGSDSGYEGCSSPFSDMSSPLNCAQAWEDSFTSELFPQLLNVHLDQPCATSPLTDPTLFWNPSPEFEDEPF